MVGVGVAIYVAYGWMAEAADFNPNAPGAAKLHVDIVRNAIAVAVGVGLGGLAALFLAFRRQQHNEHHDTEQRITELRVAAVEQLGSDRSAVRIGALHNLELLAERHPSLRQVVINEVCAYLRMPYMPPKASVVESEDADTEAEPAMIEAKLEAVKGTPDEELEVRRLAQRILERHLRQDDVNSGWFRRTRQLFHSRRYSNYWDHDRINLAGAYLYRLDLSSSTLHNADFRDAIFEGPTGFDHAQFRGPAVFGGVGAQFRDSVRVKGTIFMDIAVFDNAQFTRSASFSEAQFRDWVSFAGAIFKDWPTFADVEFASGASFLKTKFLKDAWFTKVRFGGVAAFEEETFTGTVSFMSTTAVLESELRKHLWPKGWKLVADRDRPGWVSWRERLTKKLPMMRAHDAAERRQPRSSTIRFLHEPLRRCRAVGGDTVNIYSGVVLSNRYRRYVSGLLLSALYQ